MYVCITVYTACPLAGNMIFIYHFYGCAFFFLHIIFGMTVFVVGRQLDDEVPQKTAGNFGVKGNTMQIDTMLG